ncbi:MAG: hypothetical protein QXW88_07250, partial [Thermofilum sp.]
TTTSIDDIFVNGVPVGQCPNAIQNINPVLPIVVNPGQAQVQITFNIAANQQCGTTTFNPGVSIEVKLHTTGGREYPKLTTLP